MTHFDRDEPNLRETVVAMFTADLLHRRRDASAGTGPVNFIAAPVFGRDQRVVLSVALFGQRGHIGREHVDVYAAELLASAADLTSLVGGVMPALPTFGTYGDLITRSATATAAREPM